MKSTVNRILFMRRLAFLFCFCIPIFTMSGQVGIGNTDPKATLDITTSNVVTPSNTDGILIPRVDDFPLSNPGANQDGMMVFATGNGTPLKGFYYWNNATTMWTVIGSGNKNTLDQAYDEGGSGAGRAINVDNGSLEFIGDGTPNFTGIVTNTDAKSGLQINTSGNTVNAAQVSSGIEINNNVNTNSSFANNHGVFNKMTVNGTAVNGKSYGFRNWFLPSGNNEGTLYGFYSNSQNDGDCSQYGYYSQINTDGNGYHYGYYSDIIGAGSGNKFGFHSRILSTTGGEHYGIYSDAQSATGYAAYFVGRTSLGIGYTNRYLMPAADGTAAQVIVTDGAGNLSFQNAVTDTDNQQIDQLTLSGNILNISLQDDGVAPQTVNLSTLQDGTGTDDQTIDNFSLNGTTLRLSLENDGQTPQTVNLSSLQDGTGTDDQNLLTPTLTGTTLNLGIEGGTGTSINLSAIQDGIGTDDQRVNTFGLSSGDILGISLENDGDPVQTVDLSNLSFNVTNFALAKMSMSVAQTLAPNTSTKLNFDTAVFDLNGNFNTTTDRFEVTETGYYRITASYRSNIGNTTTNWYDLYLGVNGVAVKRDDKDHHGNGTVVRQVSTVEYIASGGYIEVYGFADGGLALSNSTQFTTFEVERIR